MSYEEDRWIEIVDGEIVEQDQMAAGFLHGIIIDNLFRILDPFVRENQLGRVQTDGITFVLEERDGALNKTRIPDFFFLRKGSIPENFEWERPFPGTPTLAVEVTSPGQSVEDMFTRVRDYLEFGTEEIWVIHTAGVEVYRYRRDDPGTVRILNSNDIIIAENLFPGLEIPVSRLFDKGRIGS
jgi:Uma2 family endonuclease